MQQAPAFLDALKRCLKAKGVNYQDIATQLGISQASIKRIFAEGTLSLTRLGSILDAFELTFGEVARLADPEGVSEQGLLSFEQESVLAADTKLFAFFHLLVFGHSPQKIVEKYVLSSQQSDRYLKLLAEQGLVEIRANGQVRLLIGRNIQWREDGPLRQAYAQQIRDEFLSSKFADSQEVLAFATRSLSSGSRALIKRRIQHLLREVKELAAVEGLAAGSDTQPCGLMIGFRPYAFSVVSGLNRRRTD